MEVNLSRTKGKILARMDSHVLSAFVYYEARVAGTSKKAAKDLCNHNFNIPAQRCGEAFCGSESAAFLIQFVDSYIFLPASLHFWSIWFGFLVCQPWKGFGFIANLGLKIRYDLRNIFGNGIFCFSQESYKLSKRLWMIHCYF